MAGHNKWSKIRHKKGIKDAKKGKIFSRLSTQLTYAARQGGGDPDLNPSLRLLLANAKSEGFPADKVKKAIEKGTGEGSGAVVLEEISYEGFGPGGIAIIVDTLTDNNNRTVSDLRKIFSDMGGSMGEVGSVSWNFDVKGLVELKAGKMVKAEKYGDPDVFEPADIEGVMMAIMDLDGVEDIIEGEESLLEVYTSYTSLGSVRDAVLDMGYVVQKAQIVKLSKNDKKLEGAELEKAAKAIEVIEEYEDVQNVWTDLVE
jgi:YebC/PmpR family DNA-binding regulatory protein